MRETSTSYRFVANTHGHILIISMYNNTLGMYLDAPDPISLRSFCSACNDGILYIKNCTMI